MWTRADQSFDSILTKKLSIKHRYFFLSQQLRLQRHQGALKVEGGSQTPRLYILNLNKSKKMECHFFLGAFYL